MTPMTAALAVATHTAASLPVEQLAAVAAIEAACFDHPWGESGLADTLTNPGARMVLLSGPDSTELAAYCLYQLTLDELEILQLATRPSQQRQGLGRRLLETVLAEAAGRGCQAAFLEVRRSNLAACGLYLGAGFAQAGTRPGYYPVVAADGTVTGREDALLLRRELIEAKSL